MADLSIRHAVAATFTPRLSAEAALTRADQELDFVERHHITVIARDSESYPKSLGSLPAPPAVLYKLGDCPLEGMRMVSIVGTRKPTPYGDAFVRKLVHDLAAAVPDLCIVSGLAYGIDAAAHTAAVEAGVPTIGVLAHGLHTIYPAAHRDLARRMLQSGGALLTEYPSETQPFQGNFLERNRIVAALSAVTVIAESDIRGGAMATARTADRLGKVVMALPGRISDRMSSGCLSLLQRQQAQIITSAADLIHACGWEARNLRPQQLSLFAADDIANGSDDPSLDADSRRICEVLRQSADPVPLDVLHASTGIAIPKLTALLGDLEFDGHVNRHPGNRFSN